MERIKPTQKQLDFMDWEMGVFFHFGIRTFYPENNDWDGKEMELSEFNPMDLDCEQWIKTVKDAGATYAILTCKHHDGFANWPSRYTEYSVKNTPWKDGRGDVVKEFVDACRKYNVKVGLYYSPAQFGSVKMQGKEYDDYFINQISELLKNYGKIDYLWFDGCGSENHEYDRDRIVKVIRELQPEICIFSMWDPDVRWVGNEEGIVPLGCKNVVQSANISVMEQEAQWLSEPRFLPYECDCKIRRKSWFYKKSDEKYLRSPNELIDLYYYSVGRGGNLLLNIAPDDKGLLPKRDSKNFLEFGKKIKERFAEPVECEITRENDEYILILPEEKKINHMVIEEDLTDGESVREFEISTVTPCGDVGIYSGKMIGHKRICEFRSWTGERFKLKITDSDGEYKLRSIKLYMI